jgi:hypothetical protein
VIAHFDSVCIEAPPHEVWARLAALEQIKLWSEAVLDARCDGERSQGVGAQRSCDLIGGMTIKERWVEWDEGRSFKYEGEGIPLIRHASNRWSVRPEGDRTLLTSEAEVVLKGGLVGRLLEPLLAPPVRRAGSKTLAAFKYLVEHGEPPGVRHSKLPPAPPAC